MRIKELYKNSYTAKIINFLFKNDLTINFTETTTGKLLSKIKVPYAAEVAIILSVFYLWYEGLFVRYLPFLGNKYFLPTILIVGFLLADKSELKIKKYHLYYLLFVLAGAASSVFVASLTKKEILFVGLYLYLQFGLFLLLGETLKKKLFVLKSLLFMGLPLTLVAFYQVVTKVETRLWFSAFESGTTRAFAFFGSPNVLGLVAATLALLSFSFFLKEKKKLYLIPAGIYVATMLLTFSRTAWLAFFAGILVVSFYSFKKVFWPMMVSVPLTGVIIPQIRDRFIALFNPSYTFDSYLDGRIWAMINGWFLLKKKPILGWGPGSYGGETALVNASPVYLGGIQNGYTALYFTDNQFLQILVQTGMVGAITFLTFIVAFIVYRISVTKKDALSVVGLAAFVAFLVGGLFANVLEFGAVSALAAVVMGATNEKDI